MSGPHTSTRPRILLVDDEESIRMTLGANLDLEGFEVIEAADGREALARLEQESFDLVFTDIRMPGLNGVELFQRIKEVRPGMPVVLMSAFALESLVDEALSEGVFTVLPKPFDVSHAVETLLRAFRRPSVLVVDDVEADARSTADALNAIGVRARAAFDGEGAISLIRSGEYDVCVLDLVMPGMSGPGVVTRLRAEGLATAVIAVSGFSVPEMMHKVAANGAVACLRKPFQPAHLTRLIARTRGRARAKR